MDQEKNIINITSSTTVEGICGMLKENGFPESTIKKFEEEYIDGEGFLALENDLMYVNLIPQYGLQVKFKRFYLKVTGKELKRTPLTEVPVFQDMQPSECDNSTDIVEVSETSASDTGNPDNKKLVPYPAPLPVFTEIVRVGLTQGKGLLFLHRIIGELADFYIAKNYSLSTSPEYRNVGRSVVEKYPELGMPGNTATPWQSFSKSLSARVRNQRCSMKRKSEVLPQGSEASSPNRKRPTISRPTTPTFGFDIREMPEITEEKYKQYVEEIKSECDKTKIDKKHLGTLMRNTFARRREFIKGLPDGDVTTILEEFPVLKMENGIFEEMKLIIGKQKYDSLSSEFEKVMDLVGEMRGASSTDNDCSESEIDKQDLENLKYIQKETAYARGKGLKSKPFWREVEVTKDLKKALECNKQEPPFVAFCTNSERVRAVYLCADGKIVSKLTDADVKTGVLFLLGAYYAFDLQYPKIYSQALGFIQMCVVGNVPEKSMGQKLKRFYGLFKQKC